ncbi:unannotated protein [freshwater metagenome]|uniref:Unannotated protein n=1 Tax=freshwater metagenome TaxID=449393 RepID=A0A6J6XTX3_9ZZZZ
MIVKIIKIHTKNCNSTMIGSYRFNNIHQCGLAVETAISIVALIVETLEFSGLDLDPTEIPFRGKFGAICMLARCQRR